jgi:uncharacterized membrane protein
MRRILYSALAAYWAACVVWSQNLPDRYPIHFGASGQPDRWVSGYFEWFLLPVIATATVLLMFGVGRLANRAPQLWNIPEKKRFLALSAERRAPILSELSRVLDMAALYTVLVFVVCQWSVYRAATTEQQNLPLLFHLVVWGGMVILLIYLLRLNTRIKEKILATDAETLTGRTS